MRNLQCTQKNNPVIHIQTAQLGAVEQRWVAQLASFNYDIKYRPGKSNANADALSRIPVTLTAVEFTPAAGFEKWADSEWREAQGQDADIQMVVKCVKQHKVPPARERSTWTRTAKTLFGQRKKLQVRDHILYRQVTDPHTRKVYFQVVCPSSRREEAWRELHVAAAHAGPDRTLANFAWPTILAWYGRGGTSFPPELCRL